MKACKECRFSHGGQYFAAVNGNTISIYNTYTFENVGNLRCATLTVTVAVAVIVTYTVVGTATNAVAISVDLIPIYTTYMLRVCPISDVSLSLLQSMTTPSPFLTAASFMTCVTCRLLLHLAPLLLVLPHKAVPLPVCSV